MVDYLLGSVAGVAEEQLAVPVVLLIHTIYGFHGSADDDDAARRRWYEPVNRAIGAGLAAPAGRPRFGQEVREYVSHAAVLPEGVARRDARGHGHLGYEGGARAVTALERLSTSA